MKLVVHVSIIFAAILASWLVLSVVIGWDNHASTWCFNPDVVCMR